MTNLPDSPRPPAAPPERKLTPEQFEQVIRRAAELQARGSDDSANDGISHSELIRIGREIGISPAYLQRALAETAGASSAERTMPEKLFGPGGARAARTVPGEASAVGAQVERYLVEREWLAPVRRFADRTVYQKGRGIDIARVVTSALDVVVSSKQPQVGAGYKLRNARQVEVAVQPLEAGFSYVTIQVDLRNARAALGAAGIVTGWGGGIAVAAVLGVAVDPAAALLGLPVLGGSTLGFRAIQRHTVEHAQTHIESLLDCLERGEPLVRSRGARP